MRLKAKSVGGKGREEGEITCKFRERNDPHLRRIGRETN